MAKPNLTKLLPEAVKLVGKPKSSLASPPKQKRKQKIAEPKLTTWLN